LVLLLSLASRFVLVGGDVKLAVSCVIPFLLFSLLGSAALHSAANREMARLAKLLMEHGASLDVKDDRGHSALCAAATLCHREVVNDFLVHCRTQGRKSLREAL